MSLYAKVKKVYRLLPDSARRWAFDHAPAFILNARYHFVARLERGADPDEVYDGYYYDQDVDPLMLSSADAIARTLRREFRPRNAIDLGCGTGALMHSLEGLGVKCLGFDYATAALDRCRKRGVAARRLDITRDPFPTERADLVISTEVAEHLPEGSAHRFVELMTTLAPAAVLTAALPGSRGKDHVNEQPNEYWIAKFAERGFTYERDLTSRMRQEWMENGVAETFFRSVMIFRAVRREMAV